MLHDDTAVTVHDALRQAGGARREQNPQWMVECDRDGVDGLVAAGGKVVETQRGHQGRQAGAQRRDVVALVAVLAGEHIAVRGDQHLRFQLTEPVQRRLG